MTRHALADFLLLRRPAGDTQAYSTSPAVIRQDHDFLAALQLAAPQFYTSVFLKEQVNTKTEVTLLKYYNRYCYRPTPFGLFSVVTPTAWSAARGAERQTEKVRRDQCFVQADNHFAHLLSSKLYGPETGKLQPNPTLYRILQEYRFIRTDTDLETGKRQYLLQATDHTILLRNLLAESADGLEPQAILAFIQQTGQCEAHEAMEYLNFLKDAQVLLPVGRPNITGTDHLLWLAGQHGKVLTDPNSNTFLTYLGRTLPYKPETFDQLLQLTNAIDADVPVPVRSRLSVIRLRPNDNKQFSAREQQALSDGLYALRQLSEARRQPEMEHFIEQFDRYFEGQTLPLLNALDPETGVGYPMFDHHKDNPLLDTLNVSGYRKTEEQLHWTPAHRLLLNAWHDPEREARSPISLKTEALAKLKPEQAFKSNSGFGLFFRTNGTQVWIESAGGYHTNNLPGRFTPAHEDILTATRAMAFHEQQLNPDILFAEILHLADLSTDNVNRRDTILELEIPVTATSLGPKANQLALHDLQVSVVKGKVLLTSKKHRKVVLPRLSSAYNHTIDKLPLFRFLADIPYQYGDQVSSLDLSLLFPGLYFYPRVVYLEAILSPAQWLLTKAEILSLQQTDEATVLHRFNSLQVQLQLPKQFVWVQGDQQLYFNSENADEVLFFIACIANAKEVKLQEVLLSEDSTSEKPVPVTEQYNAFVQATQALEITCPAKPSVRAAKNKRIFMPGTEWLYLKIYVTRLGANDLLRQLAPYLRKQLRSGTIRKWFFVRYEDHAPHIRLRLLLTPTTLGPVLTDMRRMFESKVERHVIREYQVDTYSRELERYGIALFEEVEQFFWHSSELILKYLCSQQAETSTQHYLFALAITQDLIKAAFPANEAATAYAYRRYQQFSGEFDGDKIHVELDQKFRSLRPKINETLSDQSYFKKLRIQELNEQCVAQFRSLIYQTKPESQQFELLVSSLIHMHLNRLFTSDSRKQEMIVFYLLYKYSKSIRKYMLGIHKH